MSEHFSQMVGTYELPKGAKRLSRGVDSLAWLDEQKKEVIKIYHRLPADILLFYKEITDVANDMVQKSPFTGSVMIGGKERTYLFDEVVAIDRIDFTPTGKGVGISTYALGPRAADCEPDYESEFRKVVYELPPDERERFEDVFLRDSRLADQTNIDDMISDFSEHISRELNLRGILVSPVNVRLRMPHDVDTIRCKVTDLGGAISAIPFLGLWEM